MAGIDKGTQGGDRQASLLRLAEQTVVEADKLAESIKQQSRQEAEAEATQIVAAAKEEGKEEAQRLLKRARRDIASQTEAAAANAQRQAQETLEAAGKEARAIVNAATEQVPAIESEAKLEAEYIVRRFTVQFVEELRSALTEASHSMLPSLDSLMKQTRHGAMVEGQEAQPAIESPRSESTSSER